jgi:hypothetical protein
MSVLTTILQWAIPVVCGAAVTLAATAFAKVRASANGLQCLLRAEIIRQYEKWSDRGFCPVYAKEALEKAYTAYHGLGGNDVATTMYETIMKLPTEKK